MNKEKYNCVNKYSKHKTIGYINAVFKIIRVWSVLFQFADTSLIKLSKGERSTTDITYASFNPRYMFNFTEAQASV